MVLGIVFIIILFLKRTRLHQNIITFKWTFTCLCSCLLSQLQACMMELSCCSRAPEAKNACTQWTKACLGSLKGKLGIVLPPVFHADPHIPKVVGGFVKKDAECL